MSENTFPHKKQPKLTISGYLVDFLEINLTNNEKITAYTTNNGVTIEFSKNTIMYDAWRSESDDVIISDDDGVLICITHELDDHRYVAKKYVYYPEHRVLRVINSLPEI